MIPSYNPINESVWHEFGHFCVDILLIKNTDFKITSFKFTHNVIAEKRYWQCSVTCKNDKINSHAELFSIASKQEICLSLLSLYAGSVFESVYRRKYYNQYISAARIISIGSAINDGQRAKEIIENFNLSKLKFEEFKIVRSKILEDFFNLIFNSLNFITGLERLMNPIISLIEQQHRPDNDLLIELSTEEINQLILSVENLMFDNLITNAFEKMSNEMSAVL
jgi:hypothetical protein